MVARVARRLPGFRFETQPPPPADVLPRMDVAAFVGFAASGPLNIPVAVEGVAHFAAIFGDDAPLAWDPQRGEQVFAYLAPAVRAFFRNGGQRCWVVRVAGQAQSNTFTVPGLACFAHGTITPAFAWARSEGSWSDASQVGTALLSRSLQVLALQSLLDELIIDLALASIGDVLPGDLLRLTFRDEGGEQYTLLLPVTSVAPVTDSVVASPLIPDRTRRRVRTRGGPALRFQPAWRFAPLSGTASLQTFTRGIANLPIPASVPLRNVPGSPPGVELDWPTSARESVKLDLSMPFANAPPPGSLVRVDFGGRQLWLTVQDLSVENEGGSPPGKTVRLQGEGQWWLGRAASPPDLVESPLSQALTAERLSFELWARQGAADSLPLSDLGFLADHSRFWGALPTDVQLYKDVDQLSMSKHAALWQAAAYPRFPLAGSAAPEAVYFPLGMSPIADPFLAADKLPDTALERDGLDKFEAGLFLDPELIDVQTENLMTQADFLRYASPASRALTGIHAALEVEEATLIAVPDAVQRGWFLSDRQTPPAAQEPTPLPAPAGENFINCGLRVLDTPRLIQSSEPDRTGTFALSWASSLSGATFFLEESARPDFSGTALIYRGAEDQFVIYGHAQGDYYYRVRAQVGQDVSDWSNGVVVHVAPDQSWQQHPAADYSTKTLLAVHRALLRLCAARGDLLAVLALPEHDREEGMLEYVGALKSPLAPAIRVGEANMAPLGFGEVRTLSYGALYHPWLIGREESAPADLRRVPPDGAACGILARRALARGAWVAPANEALRGVVALTPPVARERWSDLQAAQINLIWQEPQGVLALNADTLSGDIDLRPINVRRLLSLLRRLALRRGTDFVFEPHDAAFQRLVQREFERLLDQMFVRGAFAGRTPAASFQVAVTSTPEDVEQGRFIVELRVAPSLPLTFLTIRLVQSGERGFVTEGR